MAVNKGEEERLKIIFEEAQRLVEKNEATSHAKLIASHYIQQRREGLNHSQALSSTRGVLSRILSDLSPEQVRRVANDGLNLGEDSWIEAMDVL